METEKKIFGYLGTFFLTITFIPQLWQTYKSKIMNDISYGFLGIQILTCVCFLTYGIILGEIPLIIANVTVFIQTFILINFKFIYRNNASV